MVEFLPNENPDACRALHSLLFVGHRLRWVDNYVPGYRVTASIPEQSQLVILFISSFEPKAKACYSNKNDV